MNEEPYFNQVTGHLYMNVERYFITELYDLNKMNKLDFSKNTTEKTYSKNTFMYNLLTSLREKINAPRRKILEK